MTDQLESRALNVLNGEAGKTVEVLEVLNEMYKAKIWLQRGYKSFHCYCVERLRMSEDSAARRLHVAELLERYPKLLRALLLERRVHISGMSLLHSIINDENAERLITEAAGKSRRYIEAMRVRERPKDDVSTGMKRQPALNCEPQPTPSVSTPDTIPTPAPVPDSKSEPIEATKSYLIEPRSPGRSVYRTMVSDETRDGYERIKDLSGKTDEDIFADMVRVYEAELLKRKHAQVKRPRRVTQAAPGTFVAAPAETLRTIGERYIPAHVKRAVWLRDDGQCQHCGTDGHICGSRRDIQYHHIVTVAHGGEATIENVSLRCKAHNLYQATLDFGADFMTKVVAAKRRKPKRRTGAAKPSEAREPRAGYLFRATPSPAERGAPKPGSIGDPASKRRRGTVPLRESSVHAAIRGWRSAGGRNPRVEPLDAAQRESFEVRLSSRRGSTLPLWNSTFSGAVTKVRNSEAGRLHLSQANHREGLLSPFAPFASAPVRGCPHY